MPADCPKESSKQKEESPSIVEDREILAYVLMSPHYYDRESCRPKQTAFSKSKLKAGKLSVCRVAHTSLETVKKQVVEPQKERHPEWHLAGTLTSTCSRIREIRFKGVENRVYCIHDDGKQGFEGHAHIGFSESFDFSEINNRAAARGELLKAFESDRPPKRLEEVFSATINE